MQHINLWVTRACRWGVGIAFAVLILAVLVQVIGRTIGVSPVWSEELTRFGLLYLAAFGAGLALVSGDLVNVDVICETLPPPWPRRLRLVSALLVTGLCALLIGPAWKFTSIGVMQTSPALRLRMDFVHASVLILLGSLLIFSLLRVLGMIFNDESGLPSQPEIPS